VTFRDDFPTGGRTIRIEARPATTADLDAFVRRLLGADWNAPDSPIQPADDLSYDEVRSVLFYDQARQFLRLLDENGGAPLTATGNLNRAYVAEMIEKLDWLRRYMAPRLKTGRYKVVSEGDVWPLSVIHGVCEYGRLIHKRRNRVLVTSRGRELLADKQAGRLYRHLFVTLFRNFSLDYLSMYRETRFVQDSIAVILWRLQLVARDWTSVERLPKEVFLDSVSDQVRAVSPWPTVESDVLRREVLEPLVWFGLLESDQADDDRYSRGEPRYRKAPLFDRFLGFIWIS
jgi:hypothetical protein